MRIEFSSSFAMSCSVPDHVLASLLKGFLEQLNRKDNVGRKHGRKRRATEDDVETLEAGKRAFALYDLYPPLHYGHYVDGPGPHLPDVEDGVCYPEASTFELDHFSYDDNVLAGLIFMCNLRTKRECFKHSLFGLPLTKKLLVEQVYPGMALFLFETDRRELWGIFRATTYGQMDIIPNAYSSGSFPCQVRFEVIGESLALTEDEFSEAMSTNYYASTKFGIALSRKQVSHLCELYMRKCTNSRDVRGNTFLHGAGQLPQLLCEGVKADKPLVERGFTRMYVNETASRTCPSRDAAASSASSEGRIFVALPNDKGNRMTHVACNGNPHSLYVNSATVDEQFRCSYPRMCLDNHFNENEIHILNSCDHLMPDYPDNNVTLYPSRINCLSTFEGANCDRFLGEHNSSRFFSMSGDMLRQDNCLVDTERHERKRSVWSRISRCEKVISDDQCNLNPGMPSSRKVSDKISETKAHGMMKSDASIMKALSKAVPSKLETSTGKSLVKACEMNVQSNVGIDIGRKSSSKDCSAKAQLKIGMHMQAVKLSSERIIAKKPPSKGCDIKAQSKSSLEIPAVKNNAKNTNKVCDPAVLKIDDTIQGTLVSQIQESNRDSIHVSDKAGITEDIDCIGQDRVSFNRRKMNSKNEAAGASADLVADLGTKTRRRLSRPDFGVDLNLKREKDGDEKDAINTNAILKTLELEEKREFGCPALGGEIHLKQRDVYVNGKEKEIWSCQCLGNLPAVLCGSHAAELSSGQQRCTIETARILAQPKEMDELFIKPMIPVQTTKSYLDSSNIGILCDKDAAFFDEEEPLLPVPEGSSAYSQAPSKEADGHLIEVDASSHLKGTSQNMQLMFVVDNSSHASNNVKLKLCDPERHISAATRVCHESATGDGQHDNAICSASALNQVHLKSFFEDGLLVSGIKLQLGPDPCVILQLRDSVQSKLSNPQLSEGRGINGSGCYNNKEKDNQSDNGT